MISKFLNFLRLKTLLNELKKIFASTTEVDAVINDTDTYVLNIDYSSTLAFDTSEIITEEGA